MSMTMSERLALADRVIGAYDVAAEDWDDTGASSFRVLFGHLGADGGELEARRMLASYLVEVCGHQAWEDWSADGAWDLIGQFEDAFEGEWDCVSDWAANFLGDAGMMAALPTWAAPYGDELAERWGRDAELSGDIMTTDAGGGRVWVWSMVG